MEKQSTTLNGIGNRIYGTGNTINDFYTAKNNLKSKKKFEGEYFEHKVNNEKYILLKPLTYMNLSGECVRPVLDYYKEDIENVIVQWVFPHHPEYNLSSLVFSSSMTAFNSSLFFSSCAFLSSRDCSFLSSEAFLSSKDCSFEAILFCSS